MIRGLVIPPFRGAARGAQWLAYLTYLAGRAWLHREDPPPARYPLNQEDMEWIRDQHTLAARPW